MASETHKEIERLCKEAKERILEHADSVQIFVTYYECGEKFTSAYTTGAGNWYARVGHVKEWIIDHDQQVRNESMRSSSEE